jgi:hypothetical protein
MSFSMFKIPPAGRFAVLLGLAILPSTMHAANLLTIVPTPTGTLSCGSGGPVGSLSLSVTALVPPTLANTITVTYVTPPGVTITGASGRTIANANVPLVFVLAPAAGCAGLNPGANSITLQFKSLLTGGATNNDVTSVSSIPASLLVPSPNAFTVTCSYDGTSLHVMGSAQTVTVTSPAAGSLTPAPLTSALGTNLTTAAIGGGAATATGGSGVGTGYSFTVVETTPGGACPTGPQNLVLTSGSLTKNIVVTFQIQTYTPLISSNTAPTLAFVKGSTTPVSVPVTLTSTRVPNAFFSVDTTTLPTWLTVDLTSGVVTGGKTLNFTTTQLTSTFSPGSYSGTVHFKVSGFSDYPLTFTLNVSNPSPTLSVEGGTTQSITWSVGTALPTTSITAVSSGAPIVYELSTTAGTLSPILASNSGLAYSFGSGIPVTFNPAVFASAVPGQILTGNVILTWGGGKTITVAINITITFTSATATASSIIPATLPTSAIGQTYTVTLYGTGFVSSTDPTYQTVAGIVNTSGATVGGVLNNNIAPADPNVVATVVNASTIVFSITVPASDALLNFFAGVPKVITFGVCNPNGTACLTPGATAKQTITIASGPVFTSSQVLSSATFAAPAKIAPYDILSIFGSNFCVNAGTGCTASGQVMYGVPTGTNLAYPTFLTPDTVGSGSTPRNLIVTFQNTLTSPTLTAVAPLLFATNGQINLIVPSTITGANGWSANAYITVSFGATGSALSSAVVGPFTVGTTDPGIFTVNADGTGDGAILDINYNLVSNTNPAAIKAGTGNSDTVQIYGTGLGVADPTQIAAYLAGLSGAPATMDGLLILGPAATPVLTVNPDVFIGGAVKISTGLVGYAGWVSGAVAGLNQVNAELPINAGSFQDTSAAAPHTIIGPEQFPVKIGTSQAGVSMWVVPELVLTAPTPVGGLGTGAAGWLSSAGSPAASTGTTPVFTPAAITLPATMAFTLGAVTTAPVATGAYYVTLNALDTGVTPNISGDLTYYMNITGPTLTTLTLLAPSTGTLIRPATYGVANGNVATVNATASGIAPYTYTMTPSGLAAIGIAVDVNGVVSTSATTPAGVYELTIAVADSTPLTPLTNTISFPVTVYPALSSSKGETVTAKATTVANVATISTTTGSVGSAVTYATRNPYSITVGGSSGIIGIPSLAAGTYYIDVAATDATVPSGTGITSINAAGGVATIYLAIVVQ